MTPADFSHAGLNLGEDHREAEQAAEPGVFGFWVFLMSDAVLFALLFATYGVMLPATAHGPTPASEYKLAPTFVETIVLLTSSLTYGIASLEMKHRTTMGRVLGWLGITLALGLAFVALELHDFAEMFSHGAYPTRSGFLSAFFGLVPLHGLHVLTGCVWIVVMMVQLLVFGVDARVKLNIVRLGLFWHFLDIVWIAIFSTVYLPGIMS